MSGPNMTSVHLLSVPLDKDYAHTLYFKDAATQAAYFISKEEKKYTEFTYLRKDNIIRIPDHIDNIIHCNYVIYKNAANTNKWYYAFIEKMEFVNHALTEVTIRTDCIQTWMFDVQFKPCFVEREHAASDVIGEHTIEEGLETGQYTTNKRGDWSFGSHLSVVVGVAKEPNGDQAKGAIYHGLYSGLDYYAFDSKNSEGVNTFLKLYDKEAVGEDVTCMFIAPDVLVADVSEGRVPSWGEKIASHPDPVSMCLNKPYTSMTYDYETSSEITTEKLDGYTPRNKKLMCYPYRYLLASNNAGATAVYRYERFYIENDSGKRTIIQPAFSAHGALTVGCSIRMFPLAYNGQKVENEDEGITMGKFPVLNWTSDAYTNWLTQNSVNIALDLAMGAGQVVAGVGIAAASSGLGTAVGGSQIVGGLSQIAGTLAQIHTQSFAPNTVKGSLNAGDVTTARGKNTFLFQDMSIRKETAQILDEYFDMYGYKCHRVKVPEKAHRKYYWYTKTIDANITGSIPQEDLQTIKDCYNRGITFWRDADPAYFKNYTRDNRQNPIV